jgi:Na+/H+ antiporter NhaD/arsenite permease-like protein
VSRHIRLWAITILLVGIGLVLVLPRTAAQAQQSAPGPLVVGRVFDQQDQPVEGAQVTLNATQSDVALDQTTTQTDGYYDLSVPKPISDTLTVQITRPHFKGAQIELDETAIQSLRSGESVVLPDTILARHVTPAFWIATAIFVVMLVLVGTGQLHNTLAALVGTGLLFGVSYLGSPVRPDLFIFTFDRAVSFINWSVIFLIMGMMIVIAVIEKTGIFQWLAFSAYRISRGRVWLLVIILMLITGIASAFLDNVTTMLLMTPITVQIALSLGITPLALLMSEVMASNVVGVSTLIGTPTNILIGSYAHITFNGFLIAQTPGVLLAMIGLIVYSEFVYRQELSVVGQASPVLIERLAERAHIKEPAHLKKAGVVGAGMLVLFVLGEQVHLVPAVTALLGATALLVWVRPDIEEMIEAVDWTTLVFFMGLFIVVGGIQEVGLISFIASTIGRLVGQNLILTMVTVVVSAAVLSTVIPNIPFTAAMLPVVAYLSAIVPGAHSKVLFFCLSIGAALGGNGSLIGASANLVTAGIADRAGYPITFMYFLKKGFPALLITVGLATLWLLFRFLILIPPPE